MIPHFPTFYSTQKKGCKIHAAFPSPPTHPHPPLFCASVHPCLLKLLRPAQDGASRPQSRLSVSRIRCGLLLSDRAESEPSIYPDIICNSSCPLFWLITAVRTIGSALRTCQPRRNSPCAPELCVARLPREARRCALSLL